MEILCACDQQYIPHTATMLCSLLEHNTDCRIHLFHNSIANCELAKLKFFVEKCTSEITFYEVEPAAFRDIRIDRWASAANYYRLLAPRLLPTSISKILIASKPRGRDTRRRTGPNCLCDFVTI